MSNSLCRLCLNSDNQKDFTQISAHGSEIIACLHLFGDVSVLDDDTTSLICSMCLKELFQCIQFRRKCLSANGFFKAQSLKIQQEIIETSWTLNSEEVVEESTTEHHDEIQDDFENFEVIEEEVEVSDDYIIEKIDECDDQFISSTMEKSDDNETETADNSELKSRNSQCRFCGLVLSRRNRRIEHERLHMLEKTQLFYKCHYCDKSFNQKTGLVPHFKGAHGYVKGPPELWKCGICEDKILKPGNMALHYEKEHTSYKFENIADEVDKSIRISRRQNNRVSSSTTLKPVKKPKKDSVFWPCSICGNTFSIYQRYQKHLKTMHKIQDQQVVDDVETLNSIANISEQSQTSKKNDSQFSCSVCNKKFASNMTVRAHEKTHLNNEYACDICGSKFRVKAYITSHMQKVHMKIFRFICNVEGCTEKFVHRELFNYHIKKHLNIRNFACQYCGKTFIARATCQIHERTHSRAKVLKNVVGYLKN